MTEPKADPDLFARTFGDAKKLDPDAAHREAHYVEMAGFVPPRVRNRFAISGALDPTLLSLQEAARDHAFATPCFDEKTKQLMIFGIMLGQLNDSAQIHAIAARRAGASWEELHAMIGLCYVFRGMPAANRGSEMLAAVALHEAKLAEKHAGPEA